MLRRFRLVDDKTIVFFCSDNGAVRMGRFKAIRKNENAKVELYDLAEDIGETNDISSEHLDIAAKMGRIMKEAHMRPRPQIEPKKPKGKRFL